MKKLTLNSMMISIALVLSFMERFIPLGLLVPVPGIKLGLANIVTLFALFYLGTASAITITVIRCVLASLLFGGMSSLLYSLSGAFLALLAMSVMKLGYQKWFSIIGISVAGAAAHNIGQILVAALMMKNWAILMYLPYLLITALVTGFITAIASSGLFSLADHSSVLKLKT